MLRTFCKTLTSISLLQCCLKNAKCENSHNYPRSKNHRVGLCEWPASQARFNGDVRTTSLDALFSHVQKSSYEGVEMSLGFFQERYFLNMSRNEVAEKVKQKAEDYKIQIFGANIWWCFDYPEQDWGKFLEEMHDEACLTAKMGGEYLTFQMWITPEYLDTCGAYRNDDVYLKKCARRIEDLHAVTSLYDLNCYIETHVQRISEDPEALCKIMDQCKINFEVNGDLSHYIFRNLRNDYPDMKRILDRMGHTHQRMCRKYGDLSVNVEDLEKDWINKGVTWEAFEFSKPGLKNGLSSRVICGESGPIHLVSDPLTTDAKLVPLYRLMCKYADSFISGDPMHVNKPSDFIF